MTGGIVLWTANTVCLNHDDNGQRIYPSGYELAHGRSEAVAREIKVTTE